MDGQFYVDHRTPFMIADMASVTLATTAKALVPAASLPALGSNYFGYPGKGVRIHLFGKLTTAATPGNGQFSLYWGTGADANGTLLQATTVFALTASQTTLSWYCDMTIRCRAIGASGSLMVTGEFGANVAVVGSTLQPLLIPSGTALPTTVDLTQNFVLSPQFSRSGSTAEVMTVQEMTWEAIG